MILQVLLCRKWSRKHAPLVCCFIILMGRSRGLSIMVEQAHSCYSTVYIRNIKWGWASNKSVDHGERKTWAFSFVPSLACYIIIIVHRICISKGCKYLGKQQNSIPFEIHSFFFFFKLEWFPIETKETWGTMSLL